MFKPRYQGLLTAEILCVELGPGAYDRGDYHAGRRGIIR
jgi:hypothetical protein